MDKRLSRRDQYVDGLDIPGPSKRNRRNSSSFSIRRQTKGTKRQLEKTPDSSDSDNDSISKQLVDMTSSLKISTDEENVPKLTNKKRTLKFLLKCNQDFDKEEDTVDCPMELVEYRAQLKRSLAKKRRRASVDCLQSLLDAEKKNDAKFKCAAKKARPNNIELDYDADISDGNCKK